MTCTALDIIYYDHYDEVEDGEWNGIDELEIGGMETMKVTDVD